MNQARWPMLACGALAIAVVAMWVRIDALEKQISSSTAVPSVTTRVATTPASPRAGEDGRTAIRRRDDAPDPDLDPEPDDALPAPATSSSPPITDAGSDEDRVQRRAQAMLDKMSDSELVDWWEARFERDPRDATRESFGSTALEPALRSHLPTGASLDKVECRKDYCRIEIAYADPLDHNLLMSKLFRGRDEISKQLGGMYTVKYSEGGGGEWDFIVLIGAPGATMVPH